MRNILTYTFTVGLMIVGLFVYVGSVYAVGDLSERQQKRIEAIRFPQEGWSQGLLDRIEAGPKFLVGVDISVEPPASNLSQKTQEELALLRVWARDARDTDTIQRIKNEDIMLRARDLFVAEGLIVEEGNDSVMALLEALYRDHGYFILKNKQDFARPRPSQLDPMLLTVIRDPMHAAYPSGHASQAYIVALVLADFDPERADLYKEFAVGVAHRREIAGVHYPSDSDAGRQLAVDVLAALRTVPAFEEQYLAAKESFVVADFGEAAKK